jgi:hypothetical protein
MMLEVLVRLRAADPWSFTVLDTLARKEGLGEIVAVTRLKSWRLDFGVADPEKARAITHKLLAETALLANPNRDTWLVLGAGGQDQAGRVGAMWQRAAGAQDAFAVRVSDREDLVGRSLVKVLRGRLGLREIVDVQFASVWLLETSRGGRGASEVAERSAVARSWRNGLLSNPHFQAAEVVPAQAYLAGSEVP